MGHHRGPKTTTQDLIFYYDTGNEKSFAGEPTTNMVSYSEYQYLADGYTEALGGWDTHEGTMLIDVSNKVPGFTNRSIKMTCVNANVYKYHFGVPLTNGQTYTISFWAKAQIAGNYDNFMLADGPGGYLTVQPSSITTLTTEFTRVKHTFSMTSRDTGTYNFATYLYGNGQVVWLTGFQVENKSQATRYLPSNGTPSTRSVTQGLIDLTRNQTINLSSVSFDSNAQMSFDGTDDFIDTNFSPTSINNPTIEAVVYRNTATGRYEAIVQNNVDSDDALYVFPNGTLGFWPCAGSSLTVPTGQWSYVAVSYNGTTLTFCVNGVIQVITTTCNDIMDWDFLRIGAHGSGDGERWIGKIAIAKLYSRPLTSSELYQNYNALKSRFNL